MDRKKILVVEDNEDSLPGCDDYIAKPIIDANLVKEKVERLLVQGRPQKAI